MRRLCDEVAEILDCLARCSHCAIGCSLDSTTFNAGVVSIVVTNTVIAIIEKKASISFQVRDQHSREGEASSNASDFQCYPA